MAELLAALAYGERVGAARARANARFAPDERRRLDQEAVADREDRNYHLMEARLHEVGTAELTGRFEPFFDAFFAGTEPTGWVEAQAWHYVGDALVSDFCGRAGGAGGPGSAEVVRRSLGSREEQEAFALDELTRAIDGNPGEQEQVATYARRIAGEALTQTQRALSRTRLLRELLGGEEGEKRLVIDLLERHRVRMDRLGVERVEADLGE